MFPSIKYTKEYESLSQKGYFVNDLNGDPFQFRYMNFIASELDFTNDAAIEWYQSVIDSAIRNMSFDGYDMLFIIVYTIDSCMILESIHLSIVNYITES
jgi:alpha-glucosidase (family GH31 glycosyl hydrolase)